MRSVIRRVALAECLLLLALAPCSPDREIIYCKSGPCGGCDICDEFPITEPWMLMEVFKLAYQRRDFDRFSALLDPEFRFELASPAPDGTLWWDRAEELSIHSRMFRPAGIMPPQPPLPEELWLVSVDITLYGATAFRDTVIPGAPPGLVWADYSAILFLETQGDADYRIEGMARFVVRQDSTLAAGDDRRFRLYRWQDLGHSTTTLTVSWTEAKLLYRAAAAHEKSAQLPG